MGPRLTPGCRINVTFYSGSLPEVWTSFDTSPEFQAVEHPTGRRNPEMRAVSLGVTRVQGGWLTEVSLSNICTILLGGSVCAYDCLFFSGEQQWANQRSFQLAMEPVSYGC